MFSQTISPAKVQRTTKKVLEFQRKYERGDYKKIAENSGYSPSHVWNSLNGNRSFNMQIVNEASARVKNR